MGETSAGPDSMSLTVRPWVTIPRLEARLGHPVQRIDWATAERLVERRLPEDQSLEFKGELYNSSSRSKQELCKDVAGMANAGGGLIVVGIVEDEQSAATSIASVGHVGDEVTRMAQVVLSGVEPMVPDLAIWHEQDSASGQAVLFILIPGSSSAPHAIRRDDVYGWPVRHDRATRWMREPELATSYRERFRTADDVTSRVVDLHRSATRCLSDAGQCWVAIACSPRRPGRLPANREGYRQWLSDAMSDLPFTVPTSTAVLGRRRIVFTDQYPYTGTSRDFHFELHADGSGFGAVVVNQRDKLDPRQQVRGKDGVLFDTDSVTHLVPSILAVLARHAANCGGGGDLAVIAQLYGAYSDPSTGRLSLGPVPLVPTEPYTDSSGVYFGPRIVPGSMPVTQPTAFDLTVPISVGYDAEHLIQSAAEITHELFAEFGSSVSEPILRTDGVVQKRAFEAALGPLFSWARLKGLLAD